MVLASSCQEEHLNRIILINQADGFSIRSAHMVRITLGIHSTVTAVGLTAAVVQDLSAKVVGANIVAGFLWRDLAR